MCQIEVSFICSVGIFSDRKTLELLTVSLSYENLLPRLTFTCFCFVCGTVPHVFICDYRKCRRLSEPYFLSSGWMSPPFQCVDCHTCPSIFQWNCPTEFCVTVTRCSFINYKPPYCFLFFHTLPLFCVDWHTFLPLFWVELSHSSLCECHTNALRVLSLIFVWMSHMRVFISLCECHTNILVSPLLLSGHSTLFLFRSWLTHSRSNLVWTATPHFSKEKLTRATSFLSFDNITNLFITTFIFPM